MSARFVGRWLVAAALVLLTGSPASGDVPPPDGVVSLTPVLEGSCIAVELLVDEGSSTSEVAWFNNDGSVTFPEVLICRGDAAGGPDLRSPLARVEDVTGPSSDWSTLSLPESVAGGAGRLFAVFRLPANAEREGVGTGGGPGLGYWVAEGGPVTLLGDPDSGWVRLSPGFRLAVGAVVPGRDSGFAFAKGAAAKPEAVPSATGTAPRVTALAPPTPNPANPSVTVRFTLAEPGPARVTLYNLRGERVATLVDSQVAVGEHLLQWSGKDDAGAVVASGVYFVRLETGGRTLVQRLALVR